MCSTRTMSGMCEGRVVVITGAGRGIGREHALAFASEGAKVVVNDLGAEVDGSGGSTGPAGVVGDTLPGMGRGAVGNSDDLGTWVSGQRLAPAALGSLGGLYQLVCHAAVLPA